MKAHRKNMRRFIFTPAALAFFALALWAGDVQAQQMAVCKNDPASTERVLCKETDTTNDIDIDLDEVTISTTAAQDAGVGVHAWKAGSGTNTGGIDVSFTNGSVTTTGDTARGIDAWHQGTGAIVVDVQDSTLNTTYRGVSAQAKKNAADDENVVSTITVDIDVSDTMITTTGAGGDGVFGQVDEKGILDIDLKDTDVTTSGVAAYGVHGNLLGTTPSGTLQIGVVGGTLSTSAGAAPAVYADHDKGTGNIEISIDGATLLTTGATLTQAQDATYYDIPSRGVFARHSGNSGNVKIELTNGASVTTSGASAGGVDVWQQGLEGSVDITLTGASVTTSGSRARAVYAWREQSGDIDITLTNPSLSTGGRLAHGVYATLWTDPDDTSKAAGTGTIRIEGRGGDITTTGVNAHGILGEGFDRTSTTLHIDLKNVAVKTESTGAWSTTDPYTYARGVYGYHRGAGILDINLQGGSVQTKGSDSYGVEARHYGEDVTGDMTKDGMEITPDIAITTGGGHSITTTGDYAHGIQAYHYSTTYETRRIDITVGGPITVSGTGARGVRVGNISSGNVVRAAGFDMEGYRLQTVTVNGRVQGAHSGVQLTGGGRVVIGPRGSIRADSGVAILATGKTPGVNSGDPDIQPKLRVDLNLGGRRVAQAIGDDWIINDKGETTIAVNNVVLHEGATGVVEDAVGRNGAWDVRMEAKGVKVTDRTDPENWVVTEPAENVYADRDFSAGDFDERFVRPPTPPAPKPRNSRVLRPVSGGLFDAAGVFLPAGGEVFIGPEGTIRARSGVAILSTGGARLLVGMELDGRRMREVIGDDWIINEGGETTIVVNKVKLHDGATGVVPGAVAPNGAWNVTIREKGVNVTTRTGSGPANWIVSEPAAGVIAGRDFSAADFIEALIPPKRVFDGSGRAGSAFQSGGRVAKHVFDATVDAAAGFLTGGGQSAGGPVAAVLETSGSGNSLHEVYAPRAALYEAFPGFLLRLNGGGPEGERLRSPGSPVWAKLSGGRGSYEPERASVGAEYDFNRFTAQVGLDVGTGEHFTGSVSVRHVTGSADVSAPTGGGEVEAKGIGASLGVSWKGAGGYYANGSLSLTDYDVDIASGDRSVGTLRKDAAARGNFLRFEAGRRIEMSGKMNLTPRAWATRSEVSIDKFTDSVDARFSLDDARRLTGGVGVVAETVRTWDGGAFSLRGSVDLEQKLGDAETVVDVSGERLVSESAETRFLFGLGGVYRKGRFSVSGEVSVGGLGSDDAEYAGRVTLGMRF